MGIVFLARDVELDRYIAVKVLSTSWLTDEGMLERFRREARIIASLRHPSIVKVYGVGSADDVHYFTMDYIEGVSLSRVLRCHGALSIDAVFTLLHQIGMGLAYAHSPARGIIHRDVKPGNILLDPEGNAILTDFGISKAAEGDNGLTRTGLIIGTPEYMSPEQCRSDTATHLSDQYSLGAVAFAMITGSPPFSGQAYDVLRAHTVEPVPSILAARPDCPPPLAHAVARMLSKHPGDRWPDIEQGLRAAEALRSVHDDSGRRAIGTMVRELMAPAGAELPHTLSLEPHADSGSRTPSWLRIRPPQEDDLETGEVVNLSAVVGFDDGKEQVGAVNWQSTDPLIALVDPATGELVATGVGTAFITASVPGLTQSIRIAVAPPRVTHLLVTPGKLELQENGTRQLRAQPRGRRGQPIERAVNWSSSDPSVVAVGEDGVVRALRAGSARVVAHCGEIQASCEVSVATQVAGLEQPYRRGGTAPSTDGAPSAEPANYGPSPAVGWSEAAVASDADIAGRRRWGSRLVIWLGVLVVTTGALMVALSLLPPPQPSPLPISDVRITDRSTGSPLSGTLQLEPSGTVQLAVMASSADGARVPHGAVSWSSSNPLVADVDSSGTLIASSAGVTMVQASLAGLTAYVPVEVRRAASDDVAATGAAPPPETTGPVSDARVRPAPSAVPDVPSPQPPGMLQLLVQPWANVFVDDRPVATETQRLELELAAGRHRLRLENPNFASVDTTIVIEPGSRTLVTKQLPPRNP
jgi:serine/threonine-protein kinase